MERTKIWSYNLATYIIKEDEVDEIKNGVAIRFRSAEGKLEAGKNANITYRNFELSLEEAQAAVVKSLQAEITRRLDGLAVLGNRYNQLTGNRYEITHILA